MPDTLTSRRFTATESPNLRERVVIAPISGRFHPRPPKHFATEGEWVEVDQVLAQVVAGEIEIEVRSRFRGWLMGMLCRPGQPVHEGDPLFWIYEH